MRCNTGCDQGENEILNARAFQIIKCAPRPSKLSTQLVCLLVWIEDAPQFLLPCSLVLEHLVVNANIVALDGEGGLGGLCLNDEVVVAVWAVLVAFLKLLRVFAEDLSALFAGKDHFERLHQGMVFLLGMTFGAIEPLAA